MNPMTLRTPSGYWNPIIWVIFLILFGLVAYLIYKAGNPKYRRDTDQVKPFLSGNLETDKEKIQVRASDIYWGFIEALKEYYGVLERMHTGDIRDYILWFVGMAAIITVILIGGI